MLGMVLAYQPVDDIFYVYINVYNKFPDCVVHSTECLHSQKVQ